MRTYYFMLILMLGFVSLKAQQQGEKKSVTTESTQSIEGQIKLNSTRISEAYRVIKSFRDTLNNPIKKTERDTTVRGIKVNKAYAYLMCQMHESKLAIHIDTNSLNSDIENLLPKGFQNNDSIFYYLVYKLDSYDYYENRVFEIKFDTLIIKQKGLVNSLFITEYNKALKSVGRRFGRVIQSAILEDEDYVTPSSQTRLDLAITDLKLAEYNLLNAINNKPTTIDHSNRVINYYESDTNLIFKSRSQFGISTNLNNAIGATFHYSLNPKGTYPFVGGIDFLFIPQGEWDFILNLKAGTTIGQFQFMLGYTGSPISTSDITSSFSGNIYYTYNKYFGGVSLTTTQILFTVGIGGD